MDAQPKPAPAGTTLDHLLLGVADLDRGVRWVESRTGVRAEVGGSHPGRGTQNALLSLGGRQYLEIIAPDPAQPPESLSMNLRDLTEPRIIGWAAATSDIHALASSIRQSGLQVRGPIDGSRARPDGKVLRWRTLSVDTSLADGEIDPIPFFIQWSDDTGHPSQDSPKGCELAIFEFAHPDPRAVEQTLNQIGIAAIVRPHVRATLSALLKTPKGNVVFH